MLAIMAETMRHLPPPTLDERIAEYAAHFSHLVLIGRSGCYCGCVEPRTDEAIRRKLADSRKVFLRQLESDESRDPVWLESVAHALGVGLEMAMTDPMARPETHARHEVEQVRERMRRAIEERGPEVERTHCWGELAMALKAACGQTLRGMRDEGTGIGPLYDALFREMHDAMVDDEIAAWRCGR